MKKITSRPSFDEEKKLWDNGYKYVVGLDEVGRGSFAGPVVVGAVVFECNVFSSLDQNGKDLFNQINDSKILTSGKRTHLDPFIKKCSMYFVIEHSSVPVINKYGVGRATEMAFGKALFKLQKKLKLDNKKNEKIFALVDGFHIRSMKGIKQKYQKAIIRGDQKSISIAAASIIAKVYRDNLMVVLHAKFPQYNFCQNKGYGTKEHREAINKHGLCDIHRRSFNLEKFCTP